jgi:hypothetical protein
MIKTEFDYGMMQSKAYLFENTRPFFWIGLICAAYGYIPHALYDVPILFYLGVGMTAISLGVRTFSAPLISTLKMISQVWTGGRPLIDLIKRLTLLAALIAASIGGTGLLGYLFYQIADLSP